MSARLEGFFRDYEAYHRTPGNKACHYVGIPLIVFAAVAMLGALGWAVVATVALLAIVYWATLSPRLAVGMAFVLSVFYVGGRPIPFSILMPAFLAGWVLQFIGHYVYERKSPAFFTNLKHLLVGPLWVLARVLSPRSVARSSV